MSMMDTSEEKDGVTVYKAPDQSERKTIVTRKEQKTSHHNLIPDDLLHNEFLNELINESLPKNYNFEVHKTIWKIQQTKSRRVLLQFPEGLIRFGPVLVDIIESYFQQSGYMHEQQVHLITMGDLTYGACCIDDLLAKSLGCDLIIHYAHSCLVPINKLDESVKYLYVFLDIKFDSNHIVKSVKHNFKPDTHRIALASTIQFVASVHDIARQLRQASFEVLLPQSRPLSAAEVLGCTAPKLPKDINTIVFICDGRFHLEALMIANPDVAAYRYDPYSRKLTHEAYAFDQMYQQRISAIHKAVEAMKIGGTVGFILGTLGRQGNERVYDTMVSRLKAYTNCKYLKVLMPEVIQETLQTIKGVEVWIQVACPRLSIDWGSAFETPLLNPYEFAQALKTLLQKESRPCDISERTYPMDFYAKCSSYDHTPNHSCTSNPNCACDTLD